MSSVTVVGSGASAVHFAQSALERGANVVMVDVGRAKPPAVMPDASFAELKREHPDPARYFLGAKFESVLFPGAKGEYYGFPPHKLYIFDGVDGFDLRADGFAPLTSFARGGLAEAWTGGAFPFNEHELADFPFEFAELSPFYDQVAERIGVIGERDDLAEFMPVHAHLEAPLELDRHAALLVERYRAARTRLNAVGCHLGRSRAAVLVRDRGARKACDQLGRCLWGCPRDSLYTPSMTLEELARHPRFSYLSGRFVTHFRFDADRTIRALVVRELASGKSGEIDVERLVLAAGTLPTSKIVLDSLRVATGAAPRLTGLMDNRQVLVPFVNLSLLGASWDPDTYQYHQLAFGFAAKEPKEYVHALITTLKSALIHPIAGSAPLDLATSTWITKNVHAALGIVNLNLHDTRRAESFVELESSGDRSRLSVRYEPAADEKRRRNAALARVKSALWRLGCLVPPGMSHVRPMGASVHYSGTLPMTRDERPLTVDRDCKSRDFANLWIADGATFPFLPAKNLTFTLMANAARIAARAF